MEQNNLEQALKDMLVILLTQELDEEFLSIVEDFLVDILDSNNYNIFNNDLFFNFINLLEMQTQTTIYLSFLIKEIKTKSIRLKISSLISDNSNRQIESSKITKYKYKQLLSPNQARITIKDQNGHILEQHVETLEDTSGEKAIKMSFSPLSQLFEKNLKLDENEL